MRHAPGSLLFAAQETIFDSPWYYVIGGLLLVGLILLLLLMLILSIVFMVRGSRDRD